MPGVKSRIAIVVCFLLLAVTSAGQNWPRFRGPEGGVASDDPKLPDVWGPRRTSPGKSNCREGPGVRRWSGTTMSS